VRAAWLPLLLLIPLGCQLPDDADPPASIEEEEPAPIEPEPTPANEPPTPFEDLLRRTPARIFVSSTVANASDAPEHLIDRRAATAWNSKTGDLRPFIAFELDPRVQLRKLEITVGYDRVIGKRDLFAENHRVTRVALERDGKRVGSYALDPHRRTPQSIDVDVPGGSFVLRVLDAVPGAQRRFREIAVSELVVLGHAPDDLLIDDAAPEVRVGSFAPAGAPQGGFRAVHDGAPYPTLEALCAAHLAISAPQIARGKARDPGDDFLGEMQPRCGRAPDRPPLTALAAPYVEVAALSLTEDLTWVDRLAVRTTDGWFLTGVVLGRTHPGPGCGQSSGYRIEAANVVARAGTSPALAITYVRRGAEWLRMDGSGFEAAARTQVACTPSGSGLTCHAATIAALVGGDWVSKSMETGNWEIVPARWDWQRTASVDATGTLRLGPCTAADGSTVVCNPKAEKLLRD
jgi:hypothetical protein